MIPGLTSAFIANALSGIKDKRTWIGLFLGLIIGCAIGWYAYGTFFAQYKIAAAENVSAVAMRKQQDVVSENKLLQLERDRLQSRIDGLQGELDLIKKEHVNCKLKPDKDSEYIESLLATNNDLVIKLQGAKLELDRNGERVKALTGDIENLRHCYSRIPDSCTNNALLSVVYDFDNKIKLRDSAIEKESLRLLKIRDQMLDLVYKAYIIQQTRVESKAQPINSLKEFENTYVNVFLRLGAAMSAFRTINDLHLHFLSHVYGNADKKLVDNLLEPTHIFEIKLEADFKSVENARSLLDGLLKLNIDDDAFFTKTIEILGSHLHTCGKKKDDKK